MSSFIPFETGYLIATVAFVVLITYMVYSGRFYQKHIKENPQKLWVAGVISLFFWSGISIDLLYTSMQTLYYDTPNGQQIAVVNHHFSLGHAIGATPLGLAAAAACVAAMYGLMYLGNVVLKHRPAPNKPVPPLESVGRR